MKILLAAKHAPYGPRRIGGVQTWCRTVATELERCGHTAVTWGPTEPQPLGGFDLGIIANVGDTMPALRWCKKNIVVCHGIIPAEKPVGDSVVFTSEEVRDYWGGFGPIIRQPIDLDFWSPAWNLRIFLTRFSYRGGLGLLEQTAKDFDLRYMHLRNADEIKAREIIRQSACVVATGRALLEAMACGVPVVLCDHRSAYQPPLLHTNIKQSMVQNYSGRGGVTPTHENVGNAISSAMELGSLREFVVQHHDVKNITNQLLDLV